MNKNFEAIKAHLDAIKALRSEPDGQSILVEFLYTPDPRLTAKLAKLRGVLVGPYTTTKARRAAKQEAGYIMEEVAFLAFRGISGAGAPECWRNPGFQIDLLVSSTDELYTCALQTVLNRDDRPFGILVECKATEGRVDEATFSRLCCIFEQNLSAVVGLGVFFTLKGATGWKAGKVVSEARLRQVVHAARTGRPVVVLDEEDVFQLDKPGALLRILQMRVKEVFTMVTSEVDPVAGYAKQSGLPARLAALL